MEDLTRLDFGPDLGVLTTWKRSAIKPPNPTICWVARARIGESLGMKEGKRASRSNSYFASNTSATLTSKPSNKSERA